MTTSNANSQLPQTANDLFGIACEGGPTSSPPETKALWKRLSFTRFEKDSRLAARAAEILLRDKDPDNASKAAQAARDVSVALERLAKTEAQRPDGAARALALQLRSLEIALQLRERNPASWFYQRTAAMAYFLSSQRAQAADNQELATQCLGGCYAVLDPLIQAGVEIDAEMRGRHAELSPQFARQETQNPLADR